VNVLILGNGLAGTLAAKTLRELDPEVGIEVLGEERYPYYPRPNLIEYLAGRRPKDKIFAFPKGWADRQRIGHRLGERATRIRPAEKKVETASGAVLSYDALLVATGARAALPPLPGIDRGGVFTLRTLDDADAILGHLDGRKRVAVLGGGLLGLEIARALSGRGAEVEVLEFFDRLLPRQLDLPAASVLRVQLEKSGISVHLGAVAKEILGDGTVSGLRFETGPDLETEAVVVAAGVKPEVALAADAGLRVGRGIVVDDRMRTSEPAIYAAGDAAEHGGRIYGIIPAAFDQARVAASAILGLDRAYGGTVPFNTLKVAGLSVTSAGEIDATGPGLESHVRSDPETGLHKKIVLHEGRLIGAIWMGTTRGAAEIARLVALKRDVGRIKKALLEDDFDFTEIP
jgi:nitrite reductase (NADH) large subunit